VNYTPQACFRRSAECKREKRAPDKKANGDMLGAGEGELSALEPVMI